MQNVTTKIRWTLYGIGMILLGSFAFLPFVFREMLTVFRVSLYGFYIGTFYVSTDAFWFVYMFVMSAPLVVYGIVCIVQAHGKAVHTHTLRQSVSVKTVTAAALCGVLTGVSLSCLAYTVNFPTSYLRYPLEDFCGALGAAVSYVLATVALIVYAHARRKPFIKKGFLLEIGVAFIGVLVGAWLLSVAHNFIEIWEDRYGFVNQIVEKFAK